MDDAGKRKVLDQYAAILVETSTHPFPAVGCLEQHSSMKPEVGPIVRATALAERDEDGAAHLPGTFGFALEMYTAFAEQQIVFILREELIVNELVAPLLVHLYLLLD